MNAFNLEEEQISSKGITLIALVITIIVLLILAAISISMLTGENGILTRADTAKNATERTDIIESARVKILEKQTENLGTLTEKELTDILTPAYGTLSNNGETTVLEKTLTTTDNKYQIPVKEIWNGKFGGAETPGVSSFDENTFTLGTNESDARNTNKYGWKVPEYTVQTSEMRTNVWRLFYQDNNYTYLITDECVGSYNPSDYYKTMKNGEELKYQTGADVSIVGQKLNPMINSLFTSSNTNSNIRTTAWLTDTSDTGMWNDYKNSDVVFAIGSPTAELFIASYNNRSNKSNTIELAIVTVGYTDNTTSGWLSRYDNYGIYNTASYGLDTWWIASPGTYEDGSMGVYGGGDIMCYRTVYNSSYAVRPIVCILTSVFNNKYTLENK